MLLGYLLELHLRRHPHLHAEYPNRHHLDFPVLGILILDHCQGWYLDLSLRLNLPVYPEFHHLHHNL